MDAGDPGGIPADRAFRDGGLERLQQLLGYQFRDPALLNLALTHSSVAYEEQTEQELREDNEQLEFLGDAVLGLVVTEHLYRMYPEFSEGAWTRLRSQFVSRPHLASVALSIGLGDFLRLGKGEEKSGGRKKPAILANAVESVIAAVYLDGGMESAVRLIRTWLLDDDVPRAARRRPRPGSHRAARTRAPAHNRRAARWRAGPARSSSTPP